MELTTQGISDEILDRVAKGERLRLSRPGGTVEFALISTEDLQLLETLEDRVDALDGALALLEAKATSDEPIAWEQVKAELRL